MKYLVLVTDEDREEQWWFELESSSLMEARAKAEIRLREMSLWPVTHAEVVEPYARMDLDEEVQNTIVVEYVLVADGSCLQNPGPGGWAALLCANGQHEQMRSGGEDQTTNNRMEITAVVQGLLMLPGPSKVRVILDSRYVLDAFDKNWIANWKKNGWKTASKEPVKNQDLWILLDQEVQKHEIIWEWVKGHSGHPLNTKVDAEANRQARLRT